MCTGPSRMDNTFGDALMVKMRDLFTHNKVFEQGGTSIAAGSIITGPAAELLDVPAQPAGEYFYQCDVHPTTMTGTLDVA